MEMEWQIRGDSASDGNRRAETSGHVSDLSALVPASRGQADDVPSTSASVLCFPASAELASWTLRPGQASGRSGVERVT